MDKRLDGLDKRLDGLEASVNSLRTEMRAELDKRAEGLEKRLEASLNSFRTEMRAEFATVHSEIRRLDNVADLRERLASVEAKLAAQQG